VLRPQLKKKIDVGENGEGGYTEPLEMSLRSRRELVNEVNQKKNARRLILRRRRGSNTKSSI